ncbi:MAG TPA: vitamin K epoxide reductase family protein [Acidimicrobiales bacterium]|nr:vitamin K epoxide reductase family protein [Acidimicrobiales bacterium]
MVRRSAERWVRVTSLVLCLAGLGVATYLTLREYLPGSVPLPCSDRGRLNCQAVLTSPYSRFAGMPVADLGVLFFVVMLLLCLPAAWRTQMTAVHQVRLAAVWAAMAMVLYLLYAQLFDVRALCLYCTATHVIAFLLFVVVLAGAHLRRLRLAR